ncbi:RNA polymerase sigma-54 [Striga asiatica]|uniref:RNA polymerase sigma-54 n=1 Tax=Striga asiatica TaxID=4170 RepID=A0A5A7PCP4_STRAF|nr:RNA polymerase sigma-54 [Striga asiatica]
MVNYFLLTKLAKTHITKKHPYYGLDAVEVGDADGGAATVGVGAVAGDAGEEDVLGGGVAEGEAVDDAGEELEDLAVDVDEVGVHHGDTAPEELRRRRDTHASFVTRGRSARYIWWDRHARCLDVHSMAHLRASAPHLSLRSPWKKMASTMLWTRADKRAALGSSAHNLLLVLPLAVLDVVQFQVPTSKRVEKIDEQVLAVLEHDVLRAVHGDERHVEEQRQMLPEILVVLVRDLR